MGSFRAAINEGEPVAWQLLNGAFAKCPQGMGPLAAADTAAYERWCYDDRAPKPPILLGGFLERFTSTSPSALLLAWLPAIAVLASAGAATAACAAAFALGVVLWSLLEYATHRALFHMRPSTNLGVAVHFLIHGVHHRHPMDPGRLIFPPTLGLAVAALLYALMRCAQLPHALACLATSGAASGYVVYDLSHYAIHHSAFSNALFQRLQSAHKAHHIAHNHTYGVSLLGAPWDYVFGSRAPTKPSAD